MNTAWLTACLLYAAALVAPVVPAHGSSMEPAFHSGQLVMVDTAYPYDQLQAGDVVAYRPRSSPGMVIGHRLVRRTMFGEWIVKGDSLQRPDAGFVTRRNYVGRITAISTKP